MLTTRELADALGVSESSIKRWADEGTLRASRTAGGHRRIARAEALRFVRETGGTLVRPALLGLPEIAAAAADPLGAGDVERLQQYLERGASTLARGLLLQRFLEGQSLSSLIDGPVRVALERIGAAWHERPDGILCEHRATSECLLALHQLRLLLPTTAGAPVAVGGAGPGDPYLLPSLAAATVLAAEGFDPVDLGADTPLDVIEQAAERSAAKLVWISLSVVPESERIARELGALGRRLLAGGAHLLVGGRAVTALRLQPQPGLHPAGSMAELAAFARGLSSATTEPA